MSYLFSALWNALCSYLGVAAIGDNDKILQDETNYL